MSTLIPFPIPHEHIVGYRFGHAEVLLVAERLLVAGNEVALSPMACKFFAGIMPSARCADHAQRCV